MKEEKVRISLRLSEEEKEKLERCATLCGISQAEFMRRLCTGNIPQPKPPKEFWDVLHTLYEVHAAFRSCVAYYPAAAENCKEIEEFIVDLQKRFTVKEAV